MSKSERNTLNFLKDELAFLERGGYGGTLPWKPLSIFLDSPSCPNRLDKDKSTPCQHCWLYQFVPEQFHQEPQACQYISLNKDGESIDTMSRQYPFEDVEQAVRNWLKTEIRRLESAQQQTGEAAGIN